MKLTKAQREVLERMAKGNRLIRSRSVHVLTPWTTVRRPTINRLLAEGLIISPFDSGTGEFGLTPLGRAAIGKE